MKTTAERIDESTVKLTVTVPAAEVDEVIEKTYKQLSAKLKVPGFRPGKAPRPVVDSYLGRESVLGDATENLVQETYPKAVDAEGLRPIESPKVEEPETVTPGEDFEWTAEVSVRPELAISVYDDLSVTVPPAEATEADVEAELEQLRGQYASLAPVEDRGVAERDFVLLSFTGYVDGETYEGNQVDKYLYQMGMGSMPAEFDEGLLGTKPGETTHIQFTIPETSSVPEFVGKTAQFDVEVHEIKAQELPEVNQDFASEVGFDSLDDLRSSLQDRLNRQKALANAQAKERLLRRQLAERLEGDVPEAMVRTRAASMMRDFVNGLESRGLNLERYLEMAGISEDVVVSDMTSQAEQSVREDLALEALFRALGLEITEADIDEELEVISSATNADKDETRGQWENMGLMPVVREQIMHKKAVNWMLENAEIEEQAPAGETEAPAGEVEEEAPAGETEEEAPSGEGIESIESEA